KPLADLFCPRAGGREYQDGCRQSRREYGSKPHRGLLSKRKGSRRFTRKTILPLGRWMSGGRVPSLAERTPPCPTLWTCVSPWPASRAGDAFQSRLAIDAPYRTRSQSSIPPATTVNRGCALILRLLRIAR